jgi:hypothetical protein
MLKLFVNLAQFFIVSSLLTVPNTIAQSDSSQKTQDSNTEIADIKTLHQVAPSLKVTALNLAVSAYNHAYQLGTVKKPILTVIDYSLPSSKKRMWVFDVVHDKLLYKTYVAHGKNSGNLYAKNFSNIHQSKASSLGTYVTQNTYYGGKGFSLNLKGLEKNYNSNAFSRRVVVHGAWYVNPQFIQSHGRAGRSWGCPAVSPQLAKPLINTIKDGSILFAYYPDKNYITNSDFAQA